MIITEYYVSRSGDHSYAVLFADQRDKSLDMTFYSLGAYYTFNHSDRSVSRVEREHPEIKKMLRGILKNRSWMQYFLFRLANILT